MTLYSNDSTESLVDKYLNMEKPQLLNELLQEKNKHYNCIKDVIGLENELILKNETIETLINKDKQTKHFGLYFELSGGYWFNNIGLFDFRTGIIWTPINNLDFKLLFNINYFNQINLGILVNIDYRLYLF